MFRYFVNSYPRLLAVIFVAVVSTACTVPGLGDQTPTPASRPQVMISNPLTGQSLPAEAEVNVLSTAIDGEGITRVELVVNGEVQRIDANAQPQPNTPFIVAQPWLARPGTYVIQVRAYNTAGVAGESAPVQVTMVTQAQAAGFTPTAPPAADTPSPTPTPATSTSTLLAPADTPPPPPSPTGPPGTPTATATPTPTPGRFTATGFEPQDRFYDIWQEVGGGRSRLGYPTGPEISGQNYAKQYFEKGLMFWWDNPDTPDFIWVIDSPAADLNSGSRWNRYPDRWDGADPFACDKVRENGDKGPVRGFGQLWCERNELQQRLGLPWEYETGSAGNPPFSRVQFFQGGVMVYNPINAEVFVLFDQGDWLRFGY